MVELAQIHHNRVVLASAPPAAEIFWRPGDEPVMGIAALDGWIKAYAGKQGLVYADYYTALSDGAGGMRHAYSKDGVHPIAAGYGVMDLLSNAAIQVALKQLGPHTAMRPDCSDI